ncbi:sodium-dependent transporter [Virgibacillus alimentarius]|uniref:NSS family neurotransmitter:Na+ symporter n=1 Tax=Virgibacillus alimentarius TaxID=698769 RepID=A0ABS4S7Z4_9BACI|nr:sodium-dependent transporter [Virgibacillus alimentarius]MBP2257603.1 NSS family neurotransmitter:Na+ symporter [Virgibacillus alimentarius]
MRENWAGRIGFIMATAGFAIGLGNIWRFSYVAGDNGGGAFLFVYLLIIVLVGIPLFYVEAALGRKTQSGIIKGLRKLTRKGSPWVSIGWLGTLAATLIMSYYLMIMGWLFAYFFKISTGTFSGMTTAQIETTYENLVSSPMEVFLYSLIPVALILFIVGRGLKNGIERFSRFFMPVLVMMLVVLAIFSVTLPGAMEGIVWYLKPDFSQVTMSTILEALGQAFFSIGIGLAAAFTYGSYLKKEDSNLVTDGSWVIALDTFIAFISGLVIFPALFAYGIAPTSGPGLLFIAIPNLFDPIPGGIFFGLVFFFLVIIAALMTGVGLVEAVVANVEEVFHFKRRTSLYLSMAIMVILSIPSILSHGPWSHVTLFGQTLFEFIDYVSGNVLLTLGGLLISLYVAFVWKFENYMKEVNLGAKFLKVGPVFKPVITLFIPVMIVVVFVSNVI